MISHPRILSINPLLTDMSSQDSTLDDNIFSHWLLRPWSFASQDAMEISTAAHVPTTDERGHVFEENDTRPHQCRTSLPALPRYSSSVHAGSENQFATGEESWWNRPMLVDRSLCFMAALTTTFAIIMIALCCTYMSDFINRTNRQSTSVGSRNPQDCRGTGNANVVCYMFFGITSAL